MEFDDAKENIQPLASGRNAERLETALNAESHHEIQEQLFEQRKEFEKSIENYSGGDPLELWYEYIEWIEQSYPKSGKETELNEIISKCLSVFENDERYKQDQRMIKLYIKYIDTEPNPHRFYELLYNAGIGTMVADLYLCWAHYYDYNDNFEKAEQVYQKGLNARAQPIDQLEQAHKQFGFSMSQRMLYKDETTRRNFLSSMDEQRLALTSLRAHKRRHVGSIRTGSAIKSYNPGRVDQQSTRNEAHSSNRMVQVFDDENKAMNEQATLPLTSPIANSEQQQLSIVQTILNSTKKQENLREPGPWTNAKIKSSRSIVTGSCNQKLAFSIMEDDDLIPLPENENMLKKGIQLPHGFIQRNIPQKEFESIPLHRDEGNNTKSMPGYDKFMLFPSKDKCFSLDELNAYKWFKKHNQVNNFTKEQDLIWQCGYEIPIRLPPFFCRINDKQDDWTLPPVNPNDVIVDGKYKYGFDINQIYSTQEYSPEELLQSKWLNGEMISQKVNEMELTCAFNRRESIFVSNASRRSMALGGRKSIIPLRTNDSPVNAPRKSILQVKKYASPSDSEGAQCIALMQQSETKIDPVIDNVDININSGCSKRKSLPKEKDNFENILKAEISSPPISRRRVEDDLFVNPEPPKFNIFEDPDTKVPEKSDKDIFKTPNLPPTTKPRISSIFLDEDQEGCTTQTFNFFIKSQSVSTPKAEKKHSLFPKISETIASNERYQELFPGNENLSPIELPQNDDGNKKQAFNCRTSDTMPKENDYLSSDPFDLVRQKLSAIMETTEDTHTTSSTATISNKSSSAEDFDLTKQHYNPTSSLAVSSQRTMTECRSQFIENTSKASSIAATNNSIMSQIKKNSEDEEIYQECVPEVTATEINTLVMIEKPTNDQATIAEQLTENKNPLQFSIFEDDLPSQRNLISFQTAEDDAQPIIVFEEKTETIPASVFNKNQTNNKSVFGHLSDQTCPSLGPFNFIEEKTDNIPKNFNTTRTANKSCFSQTIEQTIPSINHFNIEEENTETIVKQIANHQSTNRSIFAPKFNQSTFFSIENHTETIPQINDKSQFSVFQDDEAITDQIPEMLNNQNSSKLLLNSSVVDKSIFAIKDDDAPPTMCKIGPSVGLKGESILLPNITQPDILCIADKTNEFQYLKETESPTNASKMLPELTNQSQIKVGEKSVFCLEQEDSYQLMKSSVFSKKKTSFDVTSKVASTTTENQSVTLYNFKTSSNNSVAVSSNTLPKPTTAATDFDDSFYNLINSPLPRNSTFKNPFPIKNFQSQPNAALLKSNQPLAAVKCNSPKKKSKDHSMSLLKPMSDISINASNSQTPNKVIQMTFSEDNPHTALFSLHMPSIQNSTLISMETNSVETQRKSIHIKDEPTTMLSNSRETTPQKWMQKSDQSSIASPKPLNSNNLFASSAPAPSSHKSNAIASFENDFYNLLLSPCSYDAKEQGNFLEMTGIELSEDERALLMKENSLKINNESFPKFQISEPKTIRSSQFEKMTRYTVLDNKVANEQSLNPTIGVSQYEKSLTLAGNANQSIDAIASKLDIDQSKPIDSKADNNAIDQSVYIIEANGDFSTVVGNTKHELSLKQSSISENESKPHQSPFRNRAIDVESSPFCTPTNDKKEINPFDAQLQNAFLQHIDFVDYISKLDNVITVNRARPIQPDTEISFGDKNFQIINMIGKGSFAFVFSGKCLSSNKMYAFKQERPANLWELYISLEIRSRIIDQNILPGFMSIDYALIGNNSSILVSEYTEYGTLFDVCNKHKTTTLRNIDEMIVMIFANQMLSILDHLHGSNIIHGDIKPDNFLIMKRLNYGSNEIVLKLIDYGQSIDLNFFRPRQTFTSKLETKNFICTEMMEDKPWTYQIDLFCLASTLYSILCGKYMNVKKQPLGGLRSYILSEPLPMNLDETLWLNIFHSLINVRDCDSMPNLQNLRLNLKEAIVVKERFMEEKIAKFNFSIEN